MPWRPRVVTGSGAPIAGRLEAAAERALAELERRGTPPSEAELDLVIDALAGPLEKQTWPRHLPPGPLDDDLLVAYDVDAFPPGSGAAWDCWRKSMVPTLAGAVVLGALGGMVCRSAVMAPHRAVSVARPALLWHTLILPVA